MSEEKPIFKVTDRRLFNADGTPREGVEREEEKPAPEPAAPPQPEATARDEARAENAPPAGAPEPAAASRAETGPAAGAAPEAEDAQDFLMVVEFIASFAAESLGMAAHPGAGAPPSQINLPLARQCIDMLGALQHKTRGNLNSEEQHFLELILSQLRMQYVQLTQRPRPGGGPSGGPRAGGFSGSDITGGR